jgi:NADH:ubiquinone reductase (H+-translocating)
VIDFGRIRLRGALAWWIWGIAHIYFLIGLRNRLAVALNWLWIHTLDQRGARLITQGRAVIGDTAAPTSETASQRLKSVR